MSTPRKTTAKTSAAKKTTPRKTAAKKTTTQTTKAQAPIVHKTGAAITHCVINNNAASVEKHTSQALERAADAVIENAKAIQEIARSLKGVEAHMGHGIHISHVRADDAE